jgi:hypothetical protein
MVTEVHAETLEQLQHNTAKLQKPKLCIRYRPQKPKREIKNVMSFSIFSLNLRGYKYVQVDFICIFENSFYFWPFGISLSTKYFCG